MDGYIKQQYIFTQTTHPATVSSGVLTFKIPYTENPFLIQYTNFISNNSEGHGWYDGDFGNKVTTTTATLRKHASTTDLNWNVVVWGY